uniref:Uncharacterized protein n=1 Tax=Arundo donax TaxID=35708 RepID=A0A0A9AZY7_ARUDO
MLLDDDNVVEVRRPPRWRIGHGGGAWEGQLFCFGGR